MTFSILLKAATFIILYVGAKTDSKDLHPDIQNTEPYGTVYMNNLIILD